MRKCALTSLTQAHRIVDLGEVFHGAADQAIHERIALHLFFGEEGVVSLPMLAGHRDSSFPTARPPPHSTTP